MVLRGGGRKTERFSLRARSQAACGVESISRCFSCVLWWRRSCSMSWLASGRVVTFSAAKRAGRRFCSEVVRALDFSFGLRSGSEAQGDFVKAQGGAELGKGIWLVGEEKGVVIDVEGEGQATGGQSAGEEVEMSQETLAWVKPREREKSTVIVEQFEQRRLCDWWANQRCGEASDCQSWASCCIASAAPASGVFYGRCRVPGSAGEPSGGRWHDQA